MTNLRIANFNNLPDAALISAKELMALSGRSRTSLWRDVHRGSLPKPKKIGPRSVRWQALDVRHFLNEGSSND